MQNWQNQFKMHYFYVPTFFEGHLGNWEDPVRPHIWHVKEILLMKRVQNLYLGKVSECRLLNPFGDVPKSDKGGEILPPSPRIGLTKISNLALACVLFEFLLKQVCLLPFFQINMI